VIAPVVWLIAALMGPPAAAQQPELVPLTTVAVTSDFRRAAEHLYGVTASAGETVRIAIEQQGIDVVAQVRFPDGSVMMELQDAVGVDGQEPVEIVANTSGTYALVITAGAGARAPGSYSVRITGRRPATNADRVLEECRALRFTALAAEREGRFDESRASLERALSLVDAAAGTDELQAGAVLYQLAGVHRKLADTQKAEAAYQRAIAIRERLLGDNHPATALAWSQLAVLYQHTGERRKAEALLSRAMPVIETALGEEHPWFVSCLVTLATLRNDARELTEEERIIRRAMAIMERVDDDGTVQYGALLNNLGELHRQKKDYAGAEQLLLRSLALQEKLLGPDHYSVTTALQNLGVLARERGDYPAAVAYYTRALAIRERAVGAEHPDVAQVLGNLANIYRATGDYTRSLETSFRALRIWEHSSGPYLQGTLVTLGNIARTYAVLGDMPHAIAFQRRSETLVERQLGLNLVIGSERQKLAFVTSISERTDRTISLHLDRASGDLDAAALAALVLLQRKGRVLDAMIDTVAALRERTTDAHDRDLVDDLKGTISELSRLSMAPSDDPSARRRQAIAALESRRDRIEEELSDRSAEFRATLRPVTLQAVQSAIPAGAALIEYAVYRPFDPGAERNADAYRGAHYAAYVIRPTGTPMGFDLGPAVEIDKSIAVLREGLRDRDCEDLRARSRALELRILDPLRTSLGDAARLLVSPDGDLNLVPFEALVGRSGQFLIEQYPVSYLTSGRDLLRIDVKRTAAQAVPPLVIADPLFGEPARATGRDMYFPPLGVTAAEGNAIKALFPDAVLLTGARANKQALLEANAPVILHIASHGFFVGLGTHGADGAAATGNPLLRAGLALAGANLSSAARAEGILTAMEASTLNLHGTRLVTLSACDTGIGEVRNGEGVYGLRRAFVLAGAESVVMSLWSVGDAVARETMVTYYSGLRAGLGRGDALRRAKLSMLHRKGREHPYYWASFIQSGDWTGIGSPH
jgi:CHAT domain-containing protein